MCVSSVTSFLVGSCGNRVSLCDSSPERASGISVSEVKCNNTDHVETT